MSNRFSTYNAGETSKNKQIDLQRRDVRIREQEASPGMTFLKAGINTAAKTFGQIAVEATRQHFLGGKERDEVQKVASVDVPIYGQKMTTQRTKLTEAGARERNERVQAESNYRNRKTIEGQQDRLDQSERGKFERLTTKEERAGERHGITQENLVSKSKMEEYGKNRRNRQNREERQDQATLSQMESLHEKAWKDNPIRTDAMDAELKEKLTGIANKSPTEAGRERALATIPGLMNALLRAELPDGEQPAGVKSGTARQGLSASPLPRPAPVLTAAQTKDSTRKLKDIAADIYNIHALMTGPGSENLTDNEKAVHQESLDLRHDQYKTHRKGMAKAGMTIPIESKNNGGPIDGISMLGENDISWINLSEAARGDNARANANREGMRLAPPIKQPETIVSYTQDKGNVLEGLTEPSLTGFANLHAHLARLNTKSPQSQLDASNELRRSNYSATDINKAMTALRVGKMRGKEPNAVQINLMSIIARAYLPNVLEDSAGSWEHGKKFKFKYTSSAAVDLFNDYGASLDTEFKEPQVYKLLQDKGLLSLDRKDELRDFFHTFEINPTAAYNVLKGQASLRPSK